MSDTINIRRRRTVSFRTDCFASGYDTDYFVRETTGYEPVIIDISDGQNNYDVGHNPTGGFLENPIVCDGLFLDYHNADEAQQITDVPFKELRFTQPMIAIPNSALDSTAGIDHIILANDDYYKIDRLYIDPTTTPYTSHIEGIHHTGSQDVMYNGLFEQLITPSVAVDTSDLRISYHPERLWEGTITTRVLNSLELRAMFRGTDPSYSIITDIIAHMPNGALVITGNNRASDHHIAMWRYSAKRISDDSVTSILVSISMNGFLNYVIPFANYYEYAVACAAYYKWSTANVNAITNWLNNR